MNTFSAAASFCPPITAPAKVSGLEPGVINANLWPSATGATVDSTIARTGGAVELPRPSKRVGVDVGPEQESAAQDDVLVPEPALGEHSHAVDFAQLQSTGRFVRDSRLGGMFHAGKVSLREDSSTESLHVSLGPDNRVSVHVDRFSPLGERRVGGRRGYSVRRVIVHNVGIVVDYVTLFFHRRFGEQRCELTCEQLCADDHEEDLEEDLEEGTLTVEAECHDEGQPSEQPQ